MIAILLESLLYKNSFIRHYIKNKETKVYKLPKRQGGKNKEMV